MSLSTIQLLAHHFWKTTLMNRAVWGLLLLLGGLVVYAVATGWTSYREQQAMQVRYQQQARHDWLSNPDKHPHRMGHFGHFAFRNKAPLTLFDLGMERFMGNVIFMEAHRQNAVNFSEAGFSTGLLRFGEISLAMLLQLLLPLLLIFLGFDSITTERENGTLKILLSQGVSWRQLLLGKLLGLSRVMLLFCAPILLLTWLVPFLLPNHHVTADELVRLVLLSVSYGLYLLLACALIVLVSAQSQTGKTALVSLIGLWLLLTIVLPRVSQAVGAYLYPAPSGVQFLTSIQDDIIKEGDSHNPADPHYKALKDSLLAAYGVDSVAQLPVNYSGVVMAEGEKISAAIYNRHFANLQTIYDQQNRFSKALSFGDPYLAIRSLSMALAGTDYGSYVHFQQQAEAYRYKLAQTVNALQVRYISNRKPGPNDPPASVSRAHWEDIPDFQYQPTPVSVVIGQELATIGAFVGWLLVLLAALRHLSKTLTVA